MPVRNVVRDFVPQSFYYLYNSGLNGEDIFKDDRDYQTFLNIVERYLSPDQKTDKYGRPTESYYSDIELQSYCLLPKSYHLLVYTGDNPRYLTDFLRKVSTAYTMYFNKRHKRSGSLFIGRYKSIRYATDEHVVQITRCMHRAVADYKNWPYSSVQYFIGDWHSNWVRPGRVYGMYDYGTYERYLDDSFDFDEKAKLVHLES